MNRLSRRAVLKDGLLAVGSGLLAPGIFGALTQMPAKAASLGAPRALPAATGGRILVVVQLAGGNDGLQAIIPYADPLYAQMRPTIGVPKSSQIRLNTQVALHADLGALKPLWDAGEMAVVQGVGYPNPNLSHFQSMYIWQTLDMTGAQGTAQTGWLGSYLRSIGASIQQPFAGVNGGALLPEAFMAPGISVPAISSATAFSVRPDPGDRQRAGQRRQALLDFTSSFTGTTDAQTTFAKLMSDTAQAAAIGSDQFTKAAAAYKPATGANYPQQSSLAESLQIVAAAITQGLGVRVAYVTLGGFDTHADEVNALHLLYPDLAQSLAAFWQDMKAQGAADTIMMMTWSEFGRRVHENGSAGTDHGTAAPQFVFGPGVAGGLHGATPNLAELDQTGNLIFQTDFRSYYATIIQNWLGGDAQTVLGGSYPLLDFVKA
jgi:uncharacterized protein (DUF1501 family)